MTLALLIISITVVCTLVILPAVFGAWRKRKEIKGMNMDEAYLVVCLPEFIQRRAERWLGFFYSSICFFLFMSFLPLAESFWQHRPSVLFVYISVPVFLLCIFAPMFYYHCLLARKQLVVRGDRITYTTALGRPKIFKISEVKQIIVRRRQRKIARHEYVTYDEVTGYSSKSKLFTVDSTYIGYDLLRKRLADEGSLLVPFRRR